MCVLGRLRDASHSPGRNHADFSEEAQDTVGQLVADGPELDDDARALVDERPGSIALEESSQQCPLVSLRPIPNQVRKTLLVAVSSEAENIHPPCSDEA